VRFEFDFFRQIKVSEKHYIILSLSINYSMRDITSDVDYEAAIWIIKCK